MCNNVKFYDNIYQYGTRKLYPVPCHFCEGCRIDRRSLWERRITSEFVKYRSAFVTLTYDDFHLPWNRGSALPTVRMKDVSKWLDNFRHQVRKIPVLPRFSTYDFKVVFVSEYGSATKRPHYHGLILGLDWLYFKDLIRKTWHNGLVDVGPIRRGGIRYILKYMDKSPVGQYALSEFFDVGLESPRFLFSPGIGKDFFLSQIDNICEYGCAKIGSRLVPIPSYWKNKLFNYCDKNIYKMRSHQNEYVNQMNVQARSMGFDSYDSMLRVFRRNLEISYEKRKLKAHEPVMFLSASLSTFPLPPGSELVLDYI